MASVAMCDVGAYIGSPIPVRSRAQACAEWIGSMVRRHRLVCIGYERLWEAMGGTANDPVVADTLASWGIAGTDWNELLRDVHAQCQGWDSKGVYFVHAVRGNSDTSILDDIEAGRAWIVPKHDKHVPGVKYIGVKGVSPARLDGWGT